MRERDVPRRVPAAHQAAALRALDAWFRDVTRPKGGMLVLPTGAGKTFTAVRFLCQRVLADGYKVLWLAHTHHLLDQAADAFGAPGRHDVSPEVALVPEPRAELRVRVVSGTVGHHRVASAQPSDDVVVGTLQTVANALRHEHPALHTFLDSARGRLCVVFDEAHHAPAPTYRRLLEALRARYPDLALLGLTATPAYADASRRGWLPKLFPQGIVHQARRGALVADGVLARPVFETVATGYAPGFSEREYAKWVASYGDLPEHVITAVADRRDRNDFVVDTYVRDRARYGRTIMFADRWYQCDYLRSALRKRGVRADAVYAHVDADPGSVEARARRTADENARVLDAFRRGELDVLVNVRMLTEGTDVPDVQTVFLTRQTTSPVLLTQMVGRALRGPKFGGTREAYIATFVDDWSQPIEWAEFTELEAGEEDGLDLKRRERAPVQLVSIALLRRLADEMARPREFTGRTFLASLPVGWYRTEFDALVAGTDDVEHAGALTMVFDTEHAGYEAFLAALLADGRALTDSEFSRPEITQEAVAARLGTWDTAHFDASSIDCAGRLQALFHLARHVAQNGEAPRFFAFAEREQHDLDALAGAFVARDLGPRALRDSLRAEYERADRMWRALYPNFGSFEQHHGLVQQRVLDVQERGGLLAENSGILETAPPAQEVPQAVKDAVLRRDGWCLCCEATRRLQVDHIAPAYLGVSNEMGNLQTLCATCNRLKGINELNFRVNSTPLSDAPRFRLLDLPARLDARSAVDWERHIRRTLNHFFRCAAVHNVSLPQRGRTAGAWRVTLNPGNPVDWVGRDALEILREQLAGMRVAAGVSGPTSLIVERAGS